MNRLTDRMLTFVRLVLLVQSLMLLNAVAAAQDEHRVKTHSESRRLPLPSRLNGHESENPRSKTVSPSNSLLSTAISLGLIVCTILVVGRWMKRYGFRGLPSLPIEAFELLGRRTIDPKVTVHLVKCGSRVLVLGVGADGVRTLSEIDEPGEVERITQACQQNPANEDRTAERIPVSKPGTPAASSATAAQRAFLAIMAISFSLAVVSPVHAQVTRNGPVGTRPRDQAEPGPAGRVRAVQPAAFEQPNPLAFDPQQMLSPQQLGLSLKMLALMTIFSLAPSILMMTTCFVRFTVVLTLLRQALGTQQGPPNQVLTAICLFLTFLVMSPVWQKCYHEGIRPYTNPVQGEQPVDEMTALNRTVAPVRNFMSQQIDKAGNSDVVWMLLDYQRPENESTKSEASQEPESYDDVPLTVLAPAYLLSELKVGFLIGFQLFLPFLVIDLVVAVILTSLGLTMMPPSMVSLPFKLLLFVLIDGWFLTVGMLLESVKVA